MNSQVWDDSISSVIYSIDQHGHRHPCLLRISRVNVATVTISTITVVISTTAASFTSTTVTSIASANPWVPEICRWYCDLSLYPHQGVPQLWQGVTVSPGNLLPCRTAFDELTPPCLGRAILCLHADPCVGPRLISLIRRELHSLHPEFFLPRNLWKSRASFLPQFLVC